MLEKNIFHRYFLIELCTHITVIRCFCTRLNLEYFMHLTLYHTIHTFNDLEKEFKSFENMGKGENGGNQHFPIFPQCFLPFPKQVSIFQSHLFCHLQMLSILASINFVVW